MNAKLTLTNGKEVWTEDIKCPICKEQMLYDRNESDIPKTETYLENMTRPFEGVQTRQTHYYKSVFKCPKRCCSIKLEHNVDELIM